MDRMAAFGETYLRELFLYLMSRIKRNIRSIDGDSVNRDADLPVFWDDIYVPISLECYASAKTEGEEEMGIRAVIEGGRQQGKSTFLYSCIEEMLSSKEPAGKMLDDIGLDFHAHPNRRVFPLLIEPQILKGEIEGDFINIAYRTCPAAGKLTAEAFRALISFVAGSTPPKNRISEPPERITLAVLVNGYDDMTPDESSIFIKALDTFLNQYPAVDLVVTSSADYFPFFHELGYFYYRIRPLNDSQIHKYISAWIDFYVPVQEKESNVSAQLYLSLLMDPLMNTLAYSPFALNLMMRTFNSRDGVSRKITVLQRKVIDQYISSYRSEKGVHLYSDTVKTAAQYLAFTLTDLEITQFEKYQRENIFKILDNCCKDCAGMLRESVTPRALFDALVKSGLLLTEYRQTDCKIFDEQFQKHLAAEALLKGRTPQYRLYDPGEYLLERLYNPFFRDMICFVGEMNPKVAAFLYPRILEETRKLDPHSDKADYLGYILKRFTFYGDRFPAELTEEYYRRFMHDKLYPDLYEILSVAEDRGEGRHFKQTVERLFRDSYRKGKPDYCIAYLSSSLFEARWLTDSNNSRAIIDRLETFLEGDEADTYAALRALSYIHLFLRKLPSNLVRKYAAAIIESSFLRDNYVIIGIENILENGAAEPDELLCLSPQEYADMFSDIDRAMLAQVALAYKTTDPWAPPRINVPDWIREYYKDAFCKAVPEADNSSSVDTFCLCCAIDAFTSPEEKTAAYRSLEAVYGVGEADTPSKRRFRRLKKYPE